jgi:response regulator RpfG family c-di-GMP phosphodiesterase
MKMLHILVVEDEPWIAMDLEMMIIEVVTATVVIERSAAAAKKGLDEILDFAFFGRRCDQRQDVEIANILTHKHVPFVFVSGSPQSNLPCELRCVPFISKPYSQAQIETALQAFVN